MISSLKPTSCARRKLLGKKSLESRPLKVLVTGGGGFLGRYLVEMLLARGEQVRTISRRRHAALDALGVEAIQGDLRERKVAIDACRGVDIVFHTAAVAGIWGPWRHFYECNTLATQYVVDGCLEHEVSRLVFTSSPSVTFSGVDQLGVDETTPYPQKWLCHYPHTKALAEQLVLRANGEKNLATCALRPHLIWGPRDQHLIPRLLARAQAGRLRRIGEGNNVIDTIYVENAARAHLQAADALSPASPVAGKAYFLSQGEPVNCWDWINDILSLAGVAPVKKSISLRAAWRLGAAMESVYWLTRRTSEPPMTRFLAAQLATSHYFDISRAQCDFAYTPKVSLEEGMRRMQLELQAG